MKMTRRAAPPSSALRYGGYATLVGAIVVAIVLGINLFASLLPVRVDLTVERFYSLSAQTVSVLDALKQPVTITGLFEAGRQNVLADELLRKYAARSRRVTLVYRDPYRNPGLAERYAVGGEPPGAESFIVESGAKFKVIKSTELYEWASGDAERGAQIQDFVAEQAFTSAIVHVTSARDPVVYLLRGHQEAELPAELTARLERTSYVLKALTLATEPGVPEDASLVVVLAPQSDLSEAEAGRLREYLQERGGRAIVAQDLNAATFPNLAAVLASYGVAIESLLVVEGSADRHVPGEPVALLPELAAHPITSSLGAGDMPIIFPYAQAVVPVSPRRRRLALEPLLVSGDRSWGQVGWANAEPGSRRRAAGDPSGPFALAMAITDAGEGAQPESRLVVLGSSLFLFPPSSIGRLPENENLFANCLSWLTGAEEIIPIRARSISGIRYQLNLTALQFYLFAGISIIVIPAAVLVLGLVLWLRRRHL